MTVFRFVRDLNLKTSDGTANLLCLCRNDTHCILARQAKQIFPKREIEERNLCQHREERLEDLDWEARSGSCLLI